jgi:hypothetical protein
MDDLMRLQICRNVTNAMKFAEIVMARLRLVALSVTCLINLSKLNKNASLKKVVL